MEIHYNAFISYRHHPEDIRAAEQIHRALEHYRLPRALKKSTGGIHRLFRDKEELPITSNLSEDIETALKNSDFLIVICSVHTRESTWVQREIELFLSSHDRSHVLTVLVHGEPYDVIPKCLLTESRLNPATGKMEQVDLEPLSCDWRSRRRKVRSQELARLAAPLLGCSYDQLRQRQKHYKNQIRMAAVSGALGISMCFVLYFLYSNHCLEEANRDLENANIQIRENLDTALRNQSDYLAAASSDLLENGDRLTAIALAMEALPKYEGERPYVTAAEHSLGKAVGIYQPSPEVGAVASFKADAFVQNFCLSDDGKILYIQDASSMITIWDTYTYQKTGMLENIASSALYPTRKGNLVIWEREKAAITCCDSQGNILWSHPHKGMLAYEKEAGTILLLSNDEENNTQEIHFLDPDTGLLRQAALTLKPDPPCNSPMYFLQDTYETLRDVVLHAPREPDRQMMSCGILDPNTGDISVFSIPQPWIDLSAPGPDNTLLVLALDESGAFNGSFNTTLTTGPSTGYLYCCNKDDLMPLWVTPVTTDIFTETNSLQVIPGSQWIFCRNGNHCTVLDPHTGKVLSQARMPGIPSKSVVLEEDAVSLLDNGMSCFFNYASSRCTSSFIAKGPLSHAAIQKGYYTVNHLSSRVVLHRSIQDKNAVIFSEKIAFPSRCLSSGSLTALFSGDTLQLFDTDQQTILFSKTLNSYYIKSAGFSPDQKYLWLFSNLDHEIIQYDTASGQETRIPLPQKRNDQYIIYTSNTLFSDGHFFFTGYQMPEQIEFLLDFDCNSGTWNFLPLPGQQSDSGISSPYHFLTAEKEYLLLWNETDHQIYEYDLKQESFQTLAEEIHSKPFAGSFPGEQEYFFSTEAGLRLCRWGAGCQRTLCLDAAQAISCLPYGENFLVISSDGSLSLCTSEGKVLDSVKLHLYTSFYTDLENKAPCSDDISWYFTDDGTLVLKIFSSCCILNTKDWEISAFVPKAIQYLPNKDLFLTWANDGPLYTVYAIPRYTKESLLSYAKQVTGTFQLTPSQRKDYGLGSES